jgi:hypothetical protein
MRTRAAEELLRSGINAIVCRELWEMYMEECEETSEEHAWDLLASEIDELKQETR